MRNYESVIIIRPGAAAAETDLTAIIDKYSALITDFQGEIAGIDRWGLKKLAYPIKKEPQGVYLLFRFTASPEGINELERLLRIDDRILKYMTVKLTGKEEPFIPADEEEAAAVADQTPESVQTGETVDPDKVA